MAVTPVVLCLNRAGEATAHRVAKLLGAAVHGREDRVDAADVLFANALDHTRMLFQAGTPVIGVCASGILIRAVAPVLADKTSEPPVLSVSDDGAVVVPLLGGHRGANRLAAQIAEGLDAVAAVTTAGDVALGVALDEPPQGYKLANPENAKDVMAKLLSGAGARVTGDAPWLAGLPTGDGVSIACTTAPAQADLVFHPQQVTIGVGCARNCPPEAITELRGRGRGKLSIIGIGPGQHSWRTPEASALVAEAEELVGYGLYIDLLGPLAYGKQRSDFPLGGEEDRCRYALERAGEGRNVALICSGDAGIYAMGALVFELLDRDAQAQGVSDAARRVEVVSTPGVSALQGAAARAGAPLGHDFCAISLSDLLTPREDIVKRLRAAAEGDFVIAFYNPVSKRRRTLLAEARDILLKHRPADTPVMLASSLGRPEEYVRYRRLDALDVDEVDMLTVVLIGSSHSRLAQLGDGPRMFTPRGYARKIDGDLAEDGRRAAVPTPLPPSRKGA